jgi:hypothetical protein
MDAQIVPRAVDRIAGEDLERSVRECRLGADAGEFGIGDMRFDQVFEVFLCRMAPWKEWCCQFSHRPQLRFGRFPRSRQIVLMQSNVGKSAPSQASNVNDRQRTDNFGGP